jgi:integrase
MAKSIKPPKPYPDYPLFAHATKRWAKKIRGKLYYFGPWRDPQGALERYLDQRDDLYAGRQPRTDQGGITVRELCNRFLDAKRQKLETGELSELTWKDYQRTCRRLVEFIGPSRSVAHLGPDDFERLRAEFSKTNGLVGLRNQITHTRMVFKYAADADLIASPVKFGPSFQPPSRQSIRRNRSVKMFEAAEIKRILEHSKPEMKAMILLGVNCGFGNADCGRLPISALDLDRAWVTFPRPKTGVERRCPLWPETVEAIRESLAVRAKPSSEDTADLVFLTRNGGSWHKPASRYMAEQFRKLIQRIDKDDVDEPDLYRRGVGFYALRHVFETIGGESRDQVAVHAIMGHERGDMASIYRERISDERLKHVVETVRAWLYAGHSDRREEEADIIRFPNVG